MQVYVLHYVSPYEIYAIEGNRAMRPWLNYVEHLTNMSIASDRVYPGASNYEHLCGMI